MEHTSVGELVAIVILICSLGSSGMGQQEIILFCSVLLLRLGVTKQHKANQTLFPTYSWLLSLHDFQVMYIATFTQATCHWNSAYLELCKPVQEISTKCCYIYTRHVNMIGLHVIGIDTHQIHLCRISFSCNHNDITVKTHLSW